MTSDHRSHHLRESQAKKFFFLQTMNNWPMWALGVLAHLRHQHRFTCEAWVSKEAGHWNSQTSIEVSVIPPLVKFQGSRMNKEAGEQSKREKKRCTIHRKLWSSVWNTGSAPRRGSIVCPCRPFHIFFVALRWALTLFFFTAEVFQDPPPLPHHDEQDWKTDSPRGDQ